MIGIRRRVIKILAIRHHGWVTLIESGAEDAGGHQIEPEIRREKGNHYQPRQFPYTVFRRFLANASLTTFHVLDVSRSSTRRRPARRRRPAIAPGEHRRAFAS